MESKICQAGFFAWICEVLRAPAELIKLFALESISGRDTASLAYAEMEYHDEHLQDFYGGVVQEFLALATSEQLLKLVSLAFSGLSEEHRAYMFRWGVLYQWCLTHHPELFEQEEGEIVNSSDYTDLFCRVDNMVDETARLILKQAVQYWRQNGPEVYITVTSELFEHA